MEKCCKNLKHFSLELFFSILLKVVKNATYAVKNTMESCWRETNISSEHNFFAILLGKWRIDALHFLAKISTFLDQKRGPFIKLECLSEFLLSNDELVPIDSSFDSIQFCIIFKGKKQKIHLMHEVEKIQKREN